MLYAFVFTSRLSLVVAFGVIVLTIVEAVATVVRIALTPGRQAWARTGLAPTLAFTVFKSAHERKGMVVKRRIET
jgi:hypothetical protein